MSSIVRNSTCVYNVVKAANVSSIANIWKISFPVDGVRRQYFIMPAHVARYKKDGIWMISDFLQGVESNCWELPERYTDDENPRNPLYDLAWLEVSPTETADHQALCLSTEPTKSTPVTVFFRQPFTLDNTLTTKYSELASFDCRLYPTPQIPQDSDNYQSPFVEALDVGFRGLSGAIAVDAFHKVRGMFVRQVIQNELHHDKELSSAFKSPSEIRRGIFLTPQHIQRLILSEVNTSLYYFPLFNCF